MLRLVNAHEDEPYNNVGHIVALNKVVTQLLWTFSLFQLQYDGTEIYILIYGSKTLTSHQ